MNKLTKQLLQDAGYTYPDFAVLAQALVVAVASRCAEIAATNAHPETAEQIIAMFTAEDE